MRRLEFALHILNKHYPDIPVSVDTFRAGIARRCVEEYGVAVINDISGGELDADMFPNGSGFEGALYHDAYAWNPSNYAEAY